MYAPSLPLFEHCLKPVVRPGGVYLPGDRAEVLKQRPALARRPRRYDPMLTVVTGGGSGQEGGKKDWLAVADR
jgi:hypothetical protein